MQTIKTWKAQAKGPEAPGRGPTTATAASESRALAARYDDLVVRIDALHLGSPELVPRAERYQKLARAAAAALRDVASAVERGDAEKARQRRVEFDDLARAEAPLVADINAVCR